MADCTHLDEVRDVTPADAGRLRGVPEGRARREWFHLRLCLTCGHVGCCDSSPGKHASAHFRGTGHPIVRSFQPGENWGWCFERRRTCCLEV